MKFILLMLMLISHAEASGWSRKVRTHLPEKVTKIETGKTDRTTARKILGMPDLVRGDREYWALGGFKYSLELTFEGSKVKTVHYNFSEKKPSLEEFKSLIDPKLLKPSQHEPHTALVYEDEEGKLEVDLSTGKIISLRYP